MERLPPGLRAAVFHAQSGALRAHQASARGGEIVCRVVGDRVHLAGRCVFYRDGAVEM